MRNVYKSDDVIADKLVMLCEVKGKVGGMFQNSMKPILYNLFCPTMGYSVVERQGTHKAKRHNF